MFDKKRFKHPEVLMLKPRIGLSQCLLGDNVRYNGKSKRHDNICTYLSAHAELIALCPEVGAGLSTPRPAVQLIETDKLRMKGVDNSQLDVTDAVQAFSDNIAAQYQHQFQAFIFKARSPSCGLSSPIYNKEGIQINTGRGIFSATLTRQWQDCLFIQEEDLLNEEQCLQLLLDCYLLLDKQIQKRR
ncbi:MAG: DUF523 domain-containing protein [Pseudomonadales bacterium]|nr:DUF523 domain-containing protein [Pseudomonadales bacterium]